MQRRRFRMLNGQERDQSAFWPDELHSRVCAGRRLFYYERMRAEHEYE